jgi:predicted GNAT family N-acyltransferase
VVAVAWQDVDAWAALSAIRRHVFIEEQCVPEHLEWDGLDESSQHFLALDCDNNAIGCSRLLAGGQIGRMAVLPEWRRRGVGAALLQAAIAASRLQGCVLVRLSAQVTAILFYENAGFRVCSDVYLDAGIPHRDMELSLSA